MRTSSVLMVACAVGAAMCCSAALAGPVQITSQERRVRATASPSGGGDSVVETITAPDDGPFDATATAEASGDGFVSRAGSSMTSRLDDDGFHFAATLSWETEDTIRPAGAESAQAEASLFADIQFTIDEAYDFTFSRVVTVTEQSTSGAESGESFTFLFREDEQGLFSPGDSGTLEPGDYRLQFQRSTESLVSGDFRDRHSLDVTLDLTLAPSDGSSEPNPIPLPPAAWAGLSVMCGSGLFGWVRARLRARRD